METRDYLIVLLIGAAGLLLGGVIAMWKTSKAFAGFLLLLCLLAGVGAVLWWQSA
ncbi:hypothetical protein [Thermocrispum municipale]|uniref:hypothetical protein n=1 Tax=Thermocrispum municipale TaxID=37926 RepID=UPI0004053A4F|nr:hypothetical protein [Thermocrispum municipale]